MKKAILFCFFVFLLMAKSAFATAQVGDLLVYKEEATPIFSNPLESAFNAQNPRPNQLFMMTCSACWRGYIAYWKIEDGYLYLTKLVEGTCASDAREIPISIVLPGSTAPVKAVWFTGSIKIPKGKQLMYVHMGYGSVYEKEIILRFEKGKLVGEHEVDNKKDALPSLYEKEMEELHKLKIWEEKAKKGE